jgi:cytochrome d ubiquinol oxidase subunit II
MGIELSVIWAVIILFGVMMYIVMDGFDLGIGILYPFFPGKDERDVLMNTVAPVWDGNETWLVLGGAGLLAAFPLAYSVILSALYLPLIFMLVGLIFRGVAFEFRFKALEHERHFWDKAFIGGSVAATFFQGAALGAYIQGFSVTGTSFSGGPMDWLSPFAVFTGLGLLVAYALLGSTWLIMKTEGAVQARAYAVTRPLVWAMLAVIAAISIWTPMIDERIAARWFSFPNMLWFAPVPVLVLACGAMLLRALARQAHFSPFVYTLALVFLGYSGLGISVWPSIWDAAGPPQSQGFALVGALLIVPVILMYTIWSYYVFRGKVRIGEGYH